MKITILSCSKKKYPLSEGETIEAKDLYQGQIFRKSYIYAHKFLKPDRIYILSAKYGLLKPSDRVCIYDETLKNLSSERQKDWGKRVLEQMRSEGLNLESDELTFLTGKAYYKNLIGEGKCENFILPFVESQCKNQGQILKFLNTQIENEDSKKY